MSFAAATHYLYSFIIRINHRSLWVCYWAIGSSFVHLYFYCIAMECGKKKYEFLIAAWTAHRSSHFTIIFIKETKCDKLRLIADIIRFNCLFNWNECILNANEDTCTMCAMIEPHSFTNFLFKYMRWSELVSGPQLYYNLFPSICHWKKWRNVPTTNYCQQQFSKFHWFLFVRIRNVEAYFAKEAISILIYWCDSIHRRQ